MRTSSVTNEELAALEGGRAFADLSSHRKVRVTGSDARAWLHDLVTADVASLEAGRSRRSLLLTPTGRIRADFWIGCEADGFLLLQAADRPDHVGLLLSPYTLSSDVSLHDATNELALFAVPGHAAALVGRPGLSPSILGKGVDVVTPPGKAAWRVEDMFVKNDLLEASPAALEAWRIRRGVARMGPDFDQGSLPAEAALEGVIDFAKGCFLGQESVARVRNLGHPPTVLRHMGSDRELARGMPVLAGSTPVGEITSAATAAADGWVAITRVRWEAAGAKLTSGGGGALVPIRSMS
jgi:folate-binding protein YgfZ